MNFLFIYDYLPTITQNQLASEYGINLVWIGEKAPSATSVTSKYVFDMGNKMDIIFEGIVTKNPAIALKLAEDFIIGVFEMEQDTVISFHLYDHRE